MDFQVRFPNGDKVPFETLNAEAANLWGIGIKRDEVKYVFPKDTPFELKYGENESWEQMIGNAIMHPQVSGQTPMYSNWEYVRETLFNGQIDGADVWEKDWFTIQQIIKSSIDWLQPYNELIDLWESKSYSPVRIK